jgi:hypothetical protein
MVSISVAEEMLNQHQRQSEMANPTDVLGPSLQHRRSLRISHFLWLLILERKLSSHWRNKSANLSVNLDLISARNSLRSPVKPSAQTPTTARSEESSKVYLTPARPVTPQIEEGEIRPVSPNRIYLLGQGIL